MPDLSQTTTASRRPKRGLPLAAWILVSCLASLATLMTWPIAAGAEGPTSLAIDSDPSGNTATSLGRIDSCTIKSTGDTFDVDLIIQDVNQLLAWEIYIEYDPQLLEVVNRRVDMFQNANEGSNVFDVSERLPDMDGLYRVAAADTSDPPTPDSGSGVLARLTVRATGPGTTSLSVAFRDLDGDGKPDLGPFLRDVDAKPVGDTDGDTFFDGPVKDTQVAIDADCPEPSSSPVGGGSDGIATLVWVVAAAAAGVAAVTGLGMARIVRRRRGA